MYGSYVHGIFDKKEVARGVVMALGKAKGITMEHIEAVDFENTKKPSTIYWQIP